MHGAPECNEAALFSVLKQAQRVRTFLLCTVNRSLKCSETLFGFICIKCEQLLYILMFCVLCKKLDVQF